MVSRGTTQQSSAPYNRRIVLDVIRRQGRISRREIVDLVSLSPQTVANITNDLQTIGLIVARRLKGARSRGQPPIAFELNPNAGNSIGISLEPGRVSAGLVNLVGEILERRAVDIDTAARGGGAPVGYRCGAAGPPGQDRYQLHRPDDARGLERPVGVR